MTNTRRALIRIEYRRGRVCIALRCGPQEHYYRYTRLLRRYEIAGAVLQERQDKQLMEQIHRLSIEQEKEFSKAVHASQRLQEIGPALHYVKVK